MGSILLYAERDPGLVAEAKRLHRRAPKGGRRSLREIARELAAQGYTNKCGAPYSASCVKSMIDGRLWYNGEDHMRQCQMASFNIATPAGLLQKLLQEQQDFTRENCLSARHALNAVMTAYHLQEWVWWAFLNERPDIQVSLRLPRDDKGRITKCSFRKWLEKQCPAIAEARQITNGTKHYRSRIQTGAHLGAFSSGFSDAFDVSYLWVERNGREQRAEFIKELVEFWTSFFATHEIP
jgi:hypothetical protein